jgi:hypothetical protein
MTVRLLASLVVLTLSASLAWASEQPPDNHAATLKYSMSIDSFRGRSKLDPLVKAACSIGACCCRAGSQIFCTSPDACSKMGGACSAGCN